MANVLFSRTDSPSTKPITDGQIIFDTSGNGKMYLDNGTTRLEMGGAINVDATLDATSTNPIQNKGVAGVMLSELEEVRGVTKKGFLTDALATKTLDAKIGTTDISSIGDGTVTGAISYVNGKLHKKEKNTIIKDNRIAMTQTSSDEPFVCPSDGYITAESAIGITNQTVVATTSGVSIVIARSNGNFFGSDCTYVRKGMQLFLLAKTGSAFFYPLE